MLPFYESKISFYELRNQKFQRPAPTIVTEYSLFNLAISLKNKR